MTELNQRLADIGDKLNHLLEPLPSEITNDLLSQHLHFLKQSSVENSLVASKALRFAKWANIIATIAAIMATIAAIPVIIELYVKVFS